MPLTSRCGSTACWRRRSTWPTGRLPRQLLDNRRNRPRRSHALFTNRAAPRAILWVRKQFRHRGRHGARVAWGEDAGVAGEGFIAGHSAFGGAFGVERDDGLAE